MAATLDERLLDGALEVLERARPWPPRLVSKLESLLRAGDDWAVFRINPVAFARERGTPEGETVDLFLHATHAGLLEMNWHLLCPSCGMAVESFGSLRTVGNHFHCGLCHQDGDARLDDYIQVSFTVAPRVRRIAAHDRDALPLKDLLYRVLFSREARFAPGGPTFAEVVSQAAMVLDWLSPGATRTFRLAPAGGALSFVDVTAAAADCLIMVDGPPVTTPQRVALRHGGNDLVPSVVRVAPGPIDLEVTNADIRRRTLLCVNAPTEAMTTHHAATFDPFLTGSRLLTNQTFRRLFRSEVIGGTEGIGVRDVTVVFTDLTGSTQLYEGVGDLRAFSLVQQHFERLGAAVQQHAGAMVKTIGDAVMAAFGNPADGVRAALRMREEIAAWNTARGSPDLILKIGVHRGPAIAVTLNESLDYFGTHVNIAARVQGLAGPDEICLTEAVREGDGVAALLRALPVAAEEASLKGIARPVRVHRIAAATR